MNWNFYINNTSVDEPQGWADLVIKITRDDNWHGVFFEAATSTLRFYGTGADILKAQKQSSGLGAQATFRAELVCGETTDILTGSFDFGTYVENCGNICIVEIAIEKSGCLMTLRNRYDQKVDLQKATSFNNINLLQQYDGLDFDLELTAQKISLINEARAESVVSSIISDDPNWLDSDGFNNYIGWIAPPLPLILNQSLGTFNTSTIIELAGPLDGNPAQPPYPDFPIATGTATLLSDSIICDLTDTEAEFRIKGVGSVTFGAPAGVGLTVKIMRLPSGLDGTDPFNWVQEYASPIFSRLTTGTTSFDLSAIVPLVISQGDFIYFGISTRGDSINNISNFTLEFGTECFFKLSTASECQPTESKVSLINEVGARIIESVTDMCMTMKSDYYGRTDSEPYVSDYDGCGSLRVLTNGLKIRNAETTNHFMSFQEFFDGLRSIDNIGIGIEDNAELPGTVEWVRVEPVEYFYKNVKLISLPYIPNAKSALDPTMAASSIKIGYRNWEVESVNGLTEFNSIKDFRTGLSTVNNALDISTDFIAGGMPIEVTRQQSFAVSGKADTNYDNDTFIICTERSGYGYIVEKDNIEDSANIFSPETTYNWRIRPMYNLMRWFKSIANIYVNLGNSTSKLFFSSGTGNYKAEGKIRTPDDCDLENKVLPENNDLSATDFIGGSTPLLLPETIQFSYPLSVSDYNIIKANPYGYLEVQCGNGNFEKAFIKTIEYRPAAGTAAFTLIKKWP